MLRLQKSNSNNHKTYNTIFNKDEELFENGILSFMIVIISLC